ncbi:MAG: hypothetical protein NZ551_11895 [Microscillaceae bacterium]|nr:hypothetical protein [Microscillaceae bacterium]MDW8461897.1 hypothetical protein [Cytophagales bacterium]
MPHPKKIPVIVGVSQFTQFWQEDITLLHPLAMMQRTAEQAIQDTGNPSIRSLIDTVYVVNILSYSYADAPQALAEALQIEIKNKFYSAVGGNNPQYLVNKACLAIEKGEAEAILIAGAECMYGMKKALQKGMKLDFPKMQKPDYISEENPDGITSFEANYDLFLPAHTYPLFETAYRKAKNRSFEEHQEKIGKIYEKFAQTAAKNPYAWTQKAFSIQEIVEPTTENRYIALPYTKRMVANIQVDMAASILITNLQHAERLGIPTGHYVCVQGSAQLNDIWDFLQRPNFHQSLALQQAIPIALQQAQLLPEQITHFDFYSCFPIAVEMAMDVLQISENDARPLSLTGGLSFFGGAGNNYSLHAIAEAVQTIRHQPDAKVMITSVGWYMTKIAVGIYSLLPPQTPFKEQQEIILKNAQMQINQQTLPEPTQAYAGEAEIEAYTIICNPQGEPNKAVLVCKLPQGNRTLALLEQPTNELKNLITKELVGLKVQITHQNEKRTNYAKIIST